MERAVSLGIVLVGKVFQAFPGDKARCLRIRGSSKEQRRRRIHEYTVIYSNAEIQISFAQRCLQSSSLMTGRTGRDLVNDCYSTLFVSSSGWHGHVSAMFGTAPMRSEFSLR